jgi:hypothetical protein
MNRYRLLILAIAAAFLVPELAFAQAGSRGGYSRNRAPVDDYERAEKPKKEKKKKKKRSKRRKKSKESEEEEQPEMVVGSDKESIEAYLQRRLGQAKKGHREQDKWGRGMTSAWSKFWTQMYEDRKSFEIRIARQRLNLFESLDSLDETFHSQTIADFERLQSNIIKSFESQQQQKMSDYFSVLYSDLKAFQSQQDALRQQMAEEAMAAWKAQKAASGAKR